MPDDWRPVFQAGGQGRKVAALWVGFLAVTVGFAALGVLAETTSGRETGAILAGVMALFVLAMEVYRRLYVLALDEAPDGRLRMRTVRFGVARWTEHPAGALTSGEARAGEWSGRGMSGAAPWVPLNRRGHRLPLLIDLQGDVLDEAAFRRLTTPRRPAGRR